MYSEATCALIHQIERFGKLNSRRFFGDCESKKLLVAFGILFQNRWSKGEVRMRMTEVSRELMISKPAATQTVNRMVERGLVQRVNDENDRRVVYIEATERGRRLFEREQKKDMDMMERIVAHMGAENAQTLVELLGCLFDALAAETEEK